LQRFNRSLENDAEGTSWGSRNWSFHSALYAPANREYMLSYVKTLNVNCDRYTRLHLLFTRDLHRAGESHRELLEACKTLDPEIASAALWKHISEAGEYLKEFIQRHREQHS
jgi:DNA-binding GntR family transcriptional regulator